MRRISSEETSRNTKLGLIYVVLHAVGSPFSSVNPDRGLPHIENAQGERTDGFAEPLGGIVFPAQNLNLNSAGVARTG